MGGTLGPDRRDFLKESVVGMAMVGLGAAGRRGEAAPKAEMPTISLGPHRVSRLILGSNPILGYSHVSRLMSRLMTDYFTLPRIEKLVKRCLEVGINTWQTSASEKVDKTLAAVRGAGHEVNWIFLASHPHIDDPKALRETIKRNRPIAIVHHGGVSDSLWREGKIEKAHDFAKRVKDLGVLAGLSSHNPDVIKHAEDSGWDLDLYMTCFYRVTRTAEEIREELGEVPLGELYLPSDPRRMCEVVRQMRRPCLGFKILAAGRLCDRPQSVERAFRFAFSNIKRTDGVIVGMFPRFEDQPALDAALTRRFAGLSR